MNWRRLKSTLIVAGIGLLVMWPPTAEACATCFGKSDSSLAQGLNMGIFSLLGVVAIMWVGVAAFVIHLVRRGAAVRSETGVENASELENSEELVGR